VLVCFCSNSRNDEYFVLSLIAVVAGVDNPIIIGSNSVAWVTDEGTTNFVVTSDPTYVDETLGGWAAVGFGNSPNSPKSAYLAEGLAQSKTTW
jgi:hypothetical protein